MIDFKKICKTFLPIIYSFGVTVFVFVIIIIVFLIVNWIKFSDFHNASSVIINWFDLKKIEFIVGIIIGIIGIYFAVQAMLEATSAFGAASKAVQNSKEIIDAISSFFNDFSSMMPRVCELIDKAESELLIMVSLPSYGYLLDAKLGNDFFNSFNNQITKSSTAEKPNIELICFNQDLCSTFEDKIELYKSDEFEPLTEGERETKIGIYFSHKKAILNGLFDIMKNKRIIRQKYRNIFTLMQDPNIRIFIADNKKAIFAITPNFIQSNLSDFNITGYYTEDKKMVEIIRKLFYKYKSLNSMSPAEFSSFLFE